MTGRPRGLTVRLPVYFWFLVAGPNGDEFERGALGTCGIGERLRQPEVENFNFVFEVDLDIGGFQPLVRQFLAAHPNVQLQSRRLILRG